MTTEPIRRSRRAWEIQVAKGYKRMAVLHAKNLQEFYESDKPAFCKFVEATAALGTVWDKEVLDKAGIVVIEAEEPD